MTASPYVEFQVMSNFSFLRGASHPDELIAHAAKLGYHAIGLADLHSLAGVVRAHGVAKELGIKFFVGCRVRPLRKLPEEKAREDAAYRNALWTEGRPEDIGEDEWLPYSLLLYPTTREGYGNLSMLLTQGKSRAPKGACYLTADDLKSVAGDMLAIAVLERASDPSLEEDLQHLQTIFLHDALSLALTRTYGPLGEDLTTHAVGLSEQLGIPLVVTNDASYHEPERRPLADVLTCIRKGVTIDEAGLDLSPNAERYLKSPDEMWRLFAKFPDALHRGVELAGRISFSLSDIRYEYPHEICPDDLTPDEYLSVLTWKGAKERYPEEVPQNVIQQIHHELKLIRELSYAKYFLTVYDIVRFARERGILCQGRGAAANSAVCYCLGITSVDPARVNLLFERFVSKERDEPPDIDIDFEHERREEVIQYIYERYGRMRAALVSEVITYRTKLAVRDIAKVFDLPLETTENLIRLLTRLDEAPLTESRLRALNLSREERGVKWVLEFVPLLKGFPRHLSQHVGGFIISETSLARIVPIEPASMPGRTVIEWDKDDIETLGMLKIDILGLGMLTCIRKALDFVNEERQRKLLPPVSLHTVPPEDPRVYDMVCKADTVGVFQIESRAQMSMLPRLKPRCYYDLVIEVAIVRPGPIQGGMVHPYLRRRSGEEKVSYPSEAIRKVLETTLGVPIFQEQVMQLAVVAAGFSPGEADSLRRAMASWKRNKNALYAFGQKIIGGMLGRGYSKEFAVQLFEQIKGFGEYGFPQSHAASFALLVYVSAWLKCHHPAAFAAGLINSQPMGFYSPDQIVQDAKRHGVEVLPVQAGRSDWDCTLENGALRLGMRLVKGLRQSDAVKLFLVARSRSRWESITQLWKATDVPASTFRTLAKADAFSSFGYSRQQAIWETGKLRDDVLPLFAGLPTPEVPAALPVISLRNEVGRDYATIGLSLKAHPCSFIRPVLRRLGVISINEFLHDATAPHDSRVEIAGLVLVRQRPSTAAGTVFITIEDETGSGNLIVRRMVFERLRDLLCDSICIKVVGRVQRLHDVTHLIVEDADDFTGELSLSRSVSRDFH